MAIAYSILSDLKLVVSRAWGRVTDEDLTEHFRVLTADSLFDHAYDLLSDCRYITENLVTHKGIQYETSKSPYLPSARRVLLVQTALQKARGRQFSIYSSETENHFLLTDDPDHAISWLGHEAHDHLIKPLLHQ